MKNKLHLFLLIGVILVSCGSTDTADTIPEMEIEIEMEQETEPPAAALCSAPFSKGVNFSGWFEAFSAHGISFTAYTEQDFADVKSLGADVIRLPIRMHSMTGGAPDYTLDPLFLRFLDFAVDCAEKYELYIIIDNHSFDPVESTSENIDQVLLPVWAQIARRYKDRSDYVVYEILNEPHGISDSRWGEIQGMAIETIRRIDRKHAIIVGGTDYNSIGKLSAIPEYPDSNIIYTFHFYDPYLFTHQGADWGGPPLLTELEGVPFPADRGRMPRIHASLRGTWVESSLNYSYVNDASPSALYRTLDRAVSFSRERDVPVFCGEFGVFMIQSPQRDRVRWYKFVSDALDSRNISRASWDYYGGFGIFNSGRGDFNYDLNTEVVRAMGFTPPPQTPRPERPLDTGFVIFDDYPNRQYVTAGYWGETTDFSLYDINSAQGEYAIRWGNASRYNLFYFNFDQSRRDFSSLANGGFSLEFRARTESPVSFDVRFLNNESSSSIPWRMRYTIDESVLPPDGRWHTIRIPLANMSEHGAWVNAARRWVSPRREFSWKNIYQLEFVAEHSDLTDCIIWFDEIKITN
jgi:endoglucanase